MKSSQKLQGNIIYNLYACLMTSLISAGTGFGFFWVGQLINFYNVWFNIFVGMMMSALMFNTVRLMYPYRK